MSRRLFVLLAMTIIGASGAAACTSRGPSTPQERARAINYIESLERNPIGRDSLDKRMWLTEWLVKAQDINVNACCKALESLDKINETYSNQLRIQAIYSQAAFILQHPNVKNEAERQAAGLAGTLRAYQAIRRFDPTAQYPVLDNLLALQKQGKLVRYVSEQVDCGQN